jgi:hypothetical protein
MQVNISAAMVCKFKALWEEELVGGSSKQKPRLVKQIVINARLMKNSSQRIMYSIL